MQPYAAPPALSLETIRMPNPFLQFFTAARPAIPSISAAELMEIMGRDEVLVIDVREPAELQRTGRIPGALNVSNGLLAAQADASSPMHRPEFTPEKTIVLYCASGARSAMAGRALSALGYQDVRNLGSLRAWVDAGGKIERR